MEVAVTLYLHLRGEGAPLLLLYSFLLLIPLPLSVFFLSGEQWCTYVSWLNWMLSLPGPGPHLLTHFSSCNQTNTDTYTKIERYVWLHWEGAPSPPVPLMMYIIVSVCLHGHSAVTSSEPVSGGGWRTFSSLGCFGTFAPSHWPGTWNRKSL